MVSSVVLLLGAIAAWVVYGLASGLRANLAKARAAGLPYIVVPIHPFNRFWQLTFPIWTPLIKRLPKAWWEGWLFVMHPDWEYKTLSTHFDRLGHTFITVSPGRLNMWTSNAEAIRQITARRESFPKDTRNYTILGLFGSNVLTTEGTLWRMHRKVTSATFNEKNAAGTFAEAINQTQGMIQKWLGPDGKSSANITTVEHDAMTLALNIIGYVGFGMRLLWPGQSLPAGTDPKLAKYASLDPPPGYTMSFVDALATVLDKILVILLVPLPVIKRLPYKWAKEAFKARQNYEAYMDEFLQDKIAEVRSGKQEQEGMDIMGQLVRTKYGGKNGAELSDSDIKGNAFIMIVAGHETTANTLHFALLELASNPSAQRALQRDIDTIFGDSDPHTWNYEGNVNTLLASHVGAAMNETLRLLPPAVTVPKHVSPTQDQTLVIDGVKHLLPAAMGLSLSVVGVQRSKRYWGQTAGPGAGDDDLNNFDPERWFRHEGEVSEENGTSTAATAADTENYGGFQGPDTSASLFRPVRGSFMAFSDGPRSCLGRRIAQVEMIAALAVIFQRYSLELAVDEWATDAEVEAMGPGERRALYEKAQDKSQATMRLARSIITLKFHDGDFVPVRLVKRGEERFVNLE